VLSNLQFSLIKRVDGNAQFKIKLKFGRAHQPIRTNPWLSFKHNELGVMGKLASIATGVSQGWNSHV
jgi:hypothetical protein